ncbi:MAG: hypothetical protein MZW92_29915 [Comamonadaceae bacterium]|nr:hypothetical protein [Comamonadaceae bacterium]
MRAAIALTALFVIAAPAAWAQGTDDPPTLFERWQERKEKSPALEQKLLTAVDVMKKVAWMEGRWEVTEKIYKTGTTPELVAKGTRESRVDLDGRCLVSRQTVGNLKTIDALIYDALPGVLVPADHDERRTGRAPAPRRHEQLGQRRAHPLRVALGVRREGGREGEDPEGIG